MVFMLAIKITLVVAVYKNQFDFLASSKMNQVLIFREKFTDQKA